MSEPRPAATVMVLRERNGRLETYVVRRSSRSAFMPDVFVFPGGRVDAEDAAAAAAGGLRGAARHAQPAHIFAAARETFEEAGLLFATDPVEPHALAGARRELLAKTRTFADVLAELKTAIDADALCYFSRWITPPMEGRRFDTHFFVARAPATQIARADANETHDGAWIAPADALARHAGGAFALILPTIKHLERLAGFARVDDVLHFARTKAIHAVTPDAGDNGAFHVPVALEGIW